MSLCDLTLPPDCSNAHAFKPELARAAISGRYCYCKDTEPFISFFKVFIPITLIRYFFD